MDKRSVNRPVSDLDRSPDQDVLDIITHGGNSEGTPVGAPSTHAERVKVALGNMFMETPCSHCGSSKVIRAGACGVCTDCGTSQGCS